MHQLNTLYGDGFLINKIFKYIFLSCTRIIITNAKAVIYVTGFIGGMQTEYFCEGFFSCVIASKINVTPKGVHLAISKLNSILAIANLLAHNNLSQICYCGQISLQSAAVNCSFSDNLTPLGVTFILLAIVKIRLTVFFVP